MEKEGGAVEGVLTVAGFNFAGTGQNSGLLFIKLKDWSQRKDKSLSVGQWHSARRRTSSR